MGRALTTSVLILIGVTLGHAGNGRAQDISYQRTPLGDRAVGMAGAYTGVAEDASAVWYNPGGLAFQAGASVSGALSLNVFSTYHVEGGYGFRNDTADLDDEGTTTIPFFVGGMAKLGPEEDPAERRHAIAAAGVGPVVPSRRFDAAVNPSSSTGEVAAGVLRTQNRARLQYYGPSYAYRLSDDIGIGMSAFLSLHDFSYEESEAIGGFSDRQPDGTYGTASSISRISSGDAFVASLLFRIGAAWQARDNLRVGLMVQLPNLPVIRDGEVSEFVTRVGPDGSGAFEGSVQETTPGLSQPFEARLGVGYRPVPHWHLALDLSIYAPLGSNDDPWYIFGETTPDTSTGLEPNPGRFFANGVALSTIANFAVGAETVIADFIPLSFGAYSDFSPARGVNEPSDTYTPPRIDNLGLTAVIGYRRNGYNIAVGGTLTMGWGAAYGTNPDPTSSDRYVPQAARQSALYLFITGYTGAAEQLSQDVTEYRMSDEERAERDRSDAEQARLEELRRLCEERLAEELRANGTADPDTVAHEVANTLTGDETAPPRETPEDETDATDATDDASSAAPAEAAPEARPDASPDDPDDRIPPAEQPSSAD